MVERAATPSSWLAALSSLVAQSLVAQGASAFVWSVGGEIPLNEAGGGMVRRFNVSMIGSEDKAAGVVLGADGSPGAYHDILLTIPGYEGKNVAVRVSTVFGRGAGPAEEVRTAGMAPATVEDH